MFTGIVTEVGEVVGLRRGDGHARMTLRCPATAAEAGIGDSVSVSGACLTVTERTADGLAADLMGETLDRTALGGLGPGDRVNLEPALRAADRLGGHLVQGHVDGVGEVREVIAHEGWSLLRLWLPEGLRRYVVEKGSIAVDGVSLTVAEVGEDGIGIGLVPHTLEATTLGLRAPGDRVNLETDLVAKHVERLLAGGAPTPYTPRQEG